MKWPVGVMGTAPAAWHRVGMLPVLLLIALALLVAVFAWGEGIDEQVRDRARAHRRAARRVA
ncbi:MAG TPA: hypothetical protein VJN50_01795 [Actinomycetota bacterium]|nr:hypothetical protein [Actinomycetota bacterium]